MTTAALRPRGQTRGHRKEAYWEALRAAQGNTRDAAARLGVTRFAIRGTVGYWRERGQLPEDVDRLTQPGRAAARTFGWGVTRHARAEPLPHTLSNIYLTADQYAVAHGHSVGMVRKFILHHRIPGLRRVGVGADGRARALLIPANAPVLGPGQQAPPPTPLDATLYGDWLTAQGIGPPEGEWLARRGFLRVLGEAGPGKWRYVAADHPAIPERVKERARRIVGQRHNATLRIEVLSRAGKTSREVAALTGLPLPFIQQIRSRLKRRGVPMVAGRRAPPAAPAPAPTPARAGVVLDPAGEVGCTAQSALTGAYPVGAAQARLKAGWRQGKCLTCGRWRWADVPCAVATFDRAPRAGAEPEET